MANYSVAIKSSAQKELDALDDAVFSRIDARFSRWLKIHGPRDARNLKVTGISGAFESEIGA